MWIKHKSPCGSDDNTHFLSLFCNVNDVKKKRGSRVVKKSSWSQTVSISSVLTRLFAFHSPPPSRTPFICTIKAITTLISFPRGRYLSITWYTKLLTSRNVTIWKKKRMVLGLTSSSPPPPHWGCPPLPSPFFVSFY